MDVDVPKCQSANESTIDIKIPPPPPLPNFVYSLFDESKDGSFGSLEAMEDENDISDSNAHGSDSGSGSFISEDNYQDLNVNNIYQNLLVNLNGAYTSMKTLCLDDLSSNHRPHIKECWAMYLKEFTEISDGMICIWKPVHRKVDCESSCVSNFYKVRIAHWDTETLMATVEQEENSGDSGLAPSIVPIWQLRPFTDEGTPIKFTLECLQLCRFFFEKLWFSWDTDDIVKFFVEHLERRVQFLYDIENGMLSTKEEKSIIEMIRRSRFLEHNILEMEREDDFEDGSDEEMLKLLELQLEQEEIGNKIKRLENPVWRMLMKKLELTKINQNKNMKSGVGENVFLVSMKATPKVLKKVSEIIESKFHQEDVNIQIVNSLELALGSCSPQGTIFITPGTYQISGLMNFEYGGRIVGITDDGKPIILEQSEMSAIWLMMDLNVQNILYFENIVFTTEFYDDLKNDVEDYENGCKTQVGIMIKDGHLHLENCVIEGRHEQKDQECHEITHSAMVKIADGGNGMFTYHNTVVKNIKCLCWKDGRNEEVIEKSINVEWKIK